MAPFLAMILEGTGGITTLLGHESGGPWWTSTWLGLGKVTFLFIYFITAEVSYQWRCGGRVVTAQLIQPVTLLHLTNQT